MLKLVLSKNVRLCYLQTDISSRSKLIAMTKITPTDAIKLTGKARQTIYDAMDKGDLSYDQVGPRKRLIDISELERWNGGLKRDADEKMSEDVRDRQNRTSSPDTAGSAVETAALRERLTMMEDSQRRERELLQGQIDDLKQALQVANDQQTRLTALLTDQRRESDRKEAQEQAALIREMRLRQIKLERELRARDRSIFARWFGAGQGTRKRSARPTAQEAKS